jgi:hypothetical protein
LSLSAGFKPEARAWAKAFNSRILALGLLNKFGIRIFNHLNVLAFAIDPRQADMLTGYYSYRASDPLHSLARMTFRTSG